MNLGEKSPKRTSGMSWINVRGESLSYAMCGTPYHFNCSRGGPLYNEGSIQIFTSEPPYMYTIFITAQIKFGFFAEDDLIHLVAV
ncbi:hypothetical protein TNCV_2790841 [Trichonephila clavipes]|nr:hypothetical protein TNCV_2790841 [Trichonephila clavipes]